MEKRTSNTLIGMGSGKEKAGEGYKPTTRAV